MFSIAQSFVCYFAVVSHTRTAPVFFVRSVAQTYLRPKLGPSFCMFDVFRLKFGPTDISGWENIQFDMQNPILTSKIVQNWAQDRKSRPENPKKSGTKSKKSTYVWATDRIWFLWFVLFLLVFDVWLSSSGQPNFTFPDLWKSSRGGFWHVESEFAVKYS